MLKFDKVQLHALSPSTAVVVYISLFCRLGCIIGPDKIYQCYHSTNVLSELSRPLEDTGLWFIDGTQFTRWKAGADNFLWSASHHWYWILWQLVRADCLEVNLHDHSLLISLKNGSAIIKDVACHCETNLLSAFAYIFLPKHVLQPQTPGPHEFLASDSFLPWLQWPTPKYMSVQTFSSSDIWLR